jgi:hypothetical protein
MHRKFPFRVAKKYFFLLFLPSTITFNPCLYIFESVFVRPEINIIIENSQVVSKEIKIKRYKNETAGKNERVQK